MARLYFIDMIKSYSMPANERVYFRRTAEKHRPGDEEWVENSLEVLDQVVEQGPGPLEGLEPPDRIRVLKQAIAAFPPGPENHLLGQIAWMSLVEVERVRNSDEEVKSSHQKFHLNGETAFVGMSPLENPPNLAEAYGDYLELRRLSERGSGNAHSLAVDARNALNLELHHFHREPLETTQFRTLLGVVGSPSLATLGVHRLKRTASDQDRALAVERLGQLRPGLANNDYHELVSLAPRLGGKEWSRLVDSESYPSAIVTAKLIHALNLEPEEHWDEFESFSKRFLDLKMERKDVEENLLWVTKHYEKLKVAFASEENLMGLVAKTMEDAWLAPPQEGSPLNPYLQSRERLGDKLGWLASKAAVGYANSGLSEPEEVDTSILMFADEIQVGDFSLEINDHN